MGDRTGVPEIQDHGNEVSRENAEHSLNMLRQQGLIPPPRFRGMPALGCITDNRTWLVSQSRAVIGPSHLPMVSDKPFESSGRLE